MLGSPTLTLKGRNLLAKIVAANIPLTLSNIGLGDGLQEENEEVTTLANEIMKNEIESCDYNEKEGQYYIRRVFTNAELEEGFYIREVGIYAIDPDEGEILYAYTNAGEDGVDYFAPGKGKVIVKEIIEMATRFGNAENITVVIDPSIALATKEDIENLQEQITSNDNDIAVLSNPNLLINGDFQIWQRGTSFSLDSSYTGEGINMYTADRWKCYLRQGYTVKPLGAYGIRIDVIGATTTDLGCYLRQPFENTNLIGQLVTSQIKIKNVSNMRLAYLGNSDYIGIKLNSNTTYAFTHHMKNDSSYNCYNQFVLAFEIIDTNIDAYVEIEWAKLELGDKATPFYPRSYGAELLDCMRYYQGSRINGIASNTSRLELFLTVRPMMRTIPTCKIKDNNGNPNKLFNLDNAQATIDVTPATFDITGGTFQDIVFSNAPLTKGVHYGVLVDMDAEIY